MLNFRPQVVLIDIGTNDLQYTSAAVVAQQVFQAACRLVHYYQVTHVVILEVLPRSNKGRFAGTPAFQ